MGIKPPRATQNSPTLFKWCQSWGKKNDGYVHNHDLHPFVSFSILVKHLFKYQRNTNHQEIFISSTQESKSSHPKERKLKKKKFFKL